MAGAGIKLWATADTVTATEFQTYLQEQVVAVFDDATARDAAFGGAGEPTLAEGMSCYLKDTNEFQIYSGSAWVPLLDLDTWAVSSGAYTIKGDVTVGVDDTGHDVKFFGATATNGYLLWDESEDDLILGSASKLGIGITGPVTALEVASDNDLTDFTSADRGMLTLSNTDHATDDIVAMDFRYRIDSSEEPSARIGAKMGGGGSSLIFGTSNDYAGITNEALTIDPSGDSTFLGDVTVGVDDTGHDVKFFGATSGAYMLWDESDDELLIGGGAQLGIGTTAPQCPLVVRDQSNDTVSLLLRANNDGATVGKTYLAINPYDSSVDTYMGTMIGAEEYDAADRRAHMTFWTRGSNSHVAPTERMRITSAGLVALGGAIALNGDTAAANQLDDYEEGTWTPGIKFSTTAATVSMTHATYTKIGRMVHCQFTGLRPTNFNGGTGNISVTGLPFTSGASYYYGTVQGNPLAMGAGFSFIQVYVEAGTTCRLLAQSATAHIDLTDSNCATTTYFYGSFTYFV